MRERIAAKRLTVFMSQADRSKRKNLMMELMRSLQENGCMGASVFQAVEGFGRSKRRRTNRFIDSAWNLPQALVVIERPEVIERVMGMVESLAPDAVFALEDAELLLPNWDDSDSGSHGR